MDHDRAQRRQIFTTLVPKFGKIVPASFLRKPELPGIKHIHPLIEGIYKPAWSNFALSIASMLKSPYHDQMHYHSDGRWWIHYSPKAGGMNIAANAALIRCMTDAEPLLVLRQLSDKMTQSGSRYRLLGLGQVETFDTAQNLFLICGMSTAKLIEYLDLPLQDGLIETAVRLKSLEEWVPFVHEEKLSYQVNAQQRDQAFRDVVLDNYDNTCAVTGQKFVYSTVVEADAAHIIGKGQYGTDDARNGLALSKSVHWAFDQGVFTITDQYEIMLHPAAQKASCKAFPLMDAAGKRISLPTDSAYHPHQEALEWHRKERFGYFAKKQALISV